MNDARGSWSPQSSESGRVGKSYPEGKKRALADQRLVVETGGLLVEVRGTMACLIAYLVGDLEIRRDLADMTRGELVMNWGTGSPFKAHAKKGYARGSVVSDTTVAAIVASKGVSVPVNGVLGHLIAYLVMTGDVAADVERMAVGNLTISWDLSNADGQRFEAVVNRYYAPRWSSVVMGEIG